MFRENSDLRGGLQFHPDINIWIFPATNLNDSQTWTKTWQLLGKFRNIIFELFTNFPKRNKMQTKFKKIILFSNPMNTSDRSIVANFRENILKLFITMNSNSYWSICFLNFWFRIYFFNLLSIQVFDSDLLRNFIST